MHSNETGSGRVWTSVDTVFDTGVTVHGKKEILKIPRYYLLKVKLLGCRFFDLVVSFSVEVPEDQADLVDLHTYTHSYSRLLQ